MISFDMQKSSRCLHVCLGAVVDTVLAYNPKDNTFRLRLEGDGGEAVSGTLTPEILQALALKCIARLPELNMHHRVATDTEAVRRSARMIQRYDDRSIQLILREIDSENLQAFLWFMKDAALLKHILANMSRRAAEFLMDDLQQNWADRDPDNAERAVDIKPGVKAVSTMLAICRRLTDEGQLPEVAVRPEALPGDDELTGAGVDVLLKAEDVERKGGTQ